MSPQQNDETLYGKEQHIAMLNVLEDLNEAQKELQQKYKELDVIRDLTQNLSTSLDPVTIMRYVGEAIQYIFPDVTVSFVATPYQEAYEKEKTIHIFSQEKIGPQMQKGLEKCIRRNIEQNKQVRDMNAFSLDDTFTFQNHKMNDAHAREHISHSCDVLPMAIPGVLNAIMHVSSSDPDRFDTKTIDVLNAIVQNAIDTTTRINSLIESEYARLRDFVHSMADGILRFTKEGKIIVANPAFLQMTQLTDKCTLHDVIKTINSSVREETGNADYDFQNQIDTILEGKKESTHQQTYMYGKGYDIILAPVRDKEGNMFGGVLILHDITHMKEVDRMKTEFISLASHQLRTPLAAMRWFIEMLLSGDIGEMKHEQREIIQNVYESNERMILLVNALLNTSRIESGRIMVEPKKTDLKDVITSVLEEVQVRAQLKSIQPTIVFDDAVPNVRVDPRLIRHVYVNLLTNAVKYTPPHGDITISVSVEGDEIQSSVRDTGYGIPKEDQKRIFQKFFRARNIQKTETDGTGLGLYLAKMIVQASGGDIWFESKEGKGTTFFFTIPLAGTKPKKGEVTLDS